MFRTRVTVPTLTPTALAVTADGDVRVTVRYAYELRESHGCGGSDTTGYLLAERPATWSDLDQARRRVTAALAGDAASRDAHAREAAGPAPVFDDSFNGTRADFETVLAAWRETRAGAEGRAPSLTTADAWAGEGFEFFDTVGVQAANSHYRDDEDRILVLGHETQHGCRCLHGGPSLDDPDDLDEHDPDDAGRCDPRQVALIDAGPWRWLTTPDLLTADDPVQAARDRLRDLAAGWRQAIEAHQQRLTELTAAVAALPTDADMARMRPAEYAAAEQARRAGASLTWRLREAQGTTPATLFGRVVARSGVAPVVSGDAPRDKNGRLMYRSVPDRLCRVPAQRLRARMIRSAAFR